jgi:hypothetical protein
VIAPVELDPSNVQLPTDVKVPFTGHGVGLTLKLAASWAASCDTGTSVEEPVLEIRTEPFRAPPEFG